MKKLRIYTIFFCSSLLCVTPFSIHSQTTDANVTQSGTNIATVKQANAENVNGVNTINATVNQTNAVGETNNVEVTQTISDTDDPSGSLLSTTATQVGNDNTIIQKQKNDGNRSSNDFVYRSFTASQTGNYNSATQLSEDGDQGKLEFDVVQEGDNNVSKQITSQAGGSTFSQILNISKGIISQVGNRNEANQTMKSLDATGTITQQGDDNTADQVFGNLTKENHALIDQNGNKNKAVQNFVSGNSTSISYLNSYQVGDGNYSNQEVSVGNNNTGTVNQTGSVGNAPMGNEAYQTFAGDGNNAIITQNGDDNWAKQQVDGSNNKLTIDQIQYGNSGNKATQNAIGNNNGDGDWHIASIEQAGANNTATQNFYGQSENASIVQEGIDHNAEQMFTSSSVHNFTNITQKGENNSAYMYIEGARNPSYIRQDKKNSIAKQYIYGASSIGNWTLIEQNMNTSGESNLTEQYVTGQYNSTNSYQKGSYGSVLQTTLGNYNYAIVVQKGSNNTTTQQITGNDNSIVEGGIKATQYGNDGIINQIVDGDKNYAYTYQMGNENTVTQNIIGDNNSSEAFQNSNSSLALISIDQIGNSNFANLSQSIGSSEGDILQLGDGNILQGLGENFDAAINDNSSYLEVDQIGNGNIVNASQTAFEAWADINQSGYGTVANLIQN